MNYKSSNVSITTGANIFICTCQCIRFESWNLKITVDDVDDFEENWPFVRSTVFVNTLLETAELTCRIGPGQI